MVAKCALRAKSYAHFSRGYRARQETHRQKRLHQKTCLSMYYVADQVGFDFDFEYITYATLRQPLAGSLHEL